jgi:hypothetical protein
MAGPSTESTNESTTSPTKVVRYDMTGAPVDADGEAKVPTSLPIPEERNLLVPMHNPDTKLAYMTVGQLYDQLRRVLAMHPEVASSIVTTQEDDDYFACMSSVECLKKLVTPRYVH